MTQIGLVEELAQKLNATGIPFMVTGSHASSYHGQPRATNDLDIVIDPTAAQMDFFIASLGSRYYLSAEAARAALARRSMFNIIDFDSGWKADFIVRKDRPFSVEEFRRRQMGALQGCTVPIATPEDVILSKLEWDKITSSELQLRDALQVAVAKWPALDQTYLRKWAGELGVAKSLEMLLQKVEKAQGG